MEVESIFKVDSWKSVHSTGTGLKIC